jgi:hypothetical protein
MLALAGGTSWLVGFLRYRDLYAQCKKSCDEGERRESFERKKIGPLTATGAALALTGLGVLTVSAAIELWQQRERRRLSVSLAPTQLQLSGRF